MDYNMPGSTVLGILQAKTLEWVDIPFSRPSPQSRGRTPVSFIAGGFFTVWATREVVIIIIYSGEKARNSGHIQKS